MIPKTDLVDTECLNYIGLKLLQLLQDLVHFHHSLFCLLISLGYQIISWFQVLIIQAYLHLLF